MRILLLLSFLASSCLFVPSTSAPACSGFGVDPGTCFDLGEAVGDLTTDAIEMAVELSGEPRSGFLYDTFMYSMVKISEYVFSQLLDFSYCFGDFPGPLFGDTARGHREEVALIVPFAPALRLAIVELPPV